MNEAQTLFVHPKNDFTGSTRVLSNIITSEYSKKIVTIVCQSGEKGFLSELSNVRLITYANFRLLNKTIPVISDLINRLKVFFLVLFYGKRFDTIYINTIVPYSAALAALLIQKKITYHVHEKFIEKTINYRIMEYVFDHVKAHRIFVSKYTKSKYLDNPRCTSEIKYNKLPESFLKKVKVRPIVDRQRNKVLMIASLSLAKGIDIFLEVAKQLPLVNFRLILSSQQSAIDDFFSEIQVPSNCEIIPSQSDVHPFLYETDLLLSLTNPSHAIETFGMTILEAMSYGIPSVVPNVGGPIELIKHDVSGYCVDVTDVRVVAEHVVKSLEYANYKRLSDNTLRVFDDRFR